MASLSAYTLVGVHADDSSTPCATCASDVDDRSLATQCIIVQPDGTAFTYCTYAAEDDPDTPDVECDYDGSGNLMYTSDPNAGCPTPLTVETNDSCVACGSQESD
ncbi:hypothetical protein PAXRUDRAFT_835689 [Paxillus rubicundulus Ve08.2h10]|uniref:Uncharacterized protein n=1 Tax=Paxillus rubicundulus Ve08.2h10 TaxID=930991 RepID=A0A0D0D5Q5_9AGAM|nr:hypothetical protein PAXRUDRAFT_835689 [Paxillus rubicundulus Ve08.2h10]